MQQTIDNPHAQRHTEYSLILPLLAILCLLFLTRPEQVSLLLLINVFSVIAILFSAFSVVRHADVLAHRFGEPYGSLTLAMAITVLEVSLISALMAAGEAGPTLMRDTLYSVIMIVCTGLVGLALVIGGKKYAIQYVNLDGMKQYLMALIPLSLVVLVLPSLLKKETFNSMQAILVSLFSLSVYAVFLFIQTKTHQNLFVYEEDYDEEQEKQHHKPSVHSSFWHFFWLVIHLIAVIAVTKLNAPVLESLLTKLNAPAPITGFIVAILILSPEGLTALNAAANNQTQRSMNMFFGSVLATISLTVPIVTVTAAVTHQPLIFGLSEPHTLLLFATLLLCHVSFSSGRTNILNGAAHLMLFFTYLMTLFM